METEGQPCEVVILRGIPGAGKSRRAKEFYKDAVICSADDFFLDENGKYNFNGRELERAHGACLRKFLSAVLRKAPLIVVDNTNLDSVQIAPYYAIAEANEYHVVIETVSSSVEDALKRQLHEVPESKVWNMHMSLAQEEAKFPSRWKQRLVIRWDHPLK